MMIGRCEMTRASASMIIALGLLLGGVLGCSRLTNPYRCTIAGKPEPRNARDYIQRSADHLEAKEMNCALAACNQAIRLAGSDPATYHCRARVYQTQKSYEKALTDYNEVVR